MTDEEKIKAALLHMLERAEKGRRSSWHLQDYWLRRYSVRGRCSPVGKDEHVSRLGRETVEQPLKQWKVRR